MQPCSLPLYIVDLCFNGHVSLPLKKMLQELVTEAKLEEGRIAGVINAKFAELATSLNSR